MRSLLRARLAPGFAALLCAVAAAPAFPGPEKDPAARGAVSVMAHLDPDTLEVGEPAEYTLRVETPLGAADPIIEWRPEPFEVLGANPPEKRPERGRTIEIRRYRIASYQIEDAFVPPPRVLCVAGGDTLAASADTLPVVFRSTLAAAGDTALAPLDRKSVV